MTGLALRLAALAALAGPVPLQAQAPVSPEARESLECAIWASYFSVEFDGQDESIAFTHALNYFVGRYEGLTNQGIDTVVDTAAILDIAERIDELTPTCTGLMVEYGGRMANWGKTLDAIGDGLPSDPVPGETS